MTVDLKAFRKAVSKADLTAESLGRQSAQPWADLRVEMMDEKTAVLMVATRADLKVRRSAAVTAVTTAEWTAVTLVYKMAALMAAQKASR